MKGYSVLHVVILLGVSACQTLPPVHDVRFVTHADGTVTDRQRGLMWMRCSLGQQWDGHHCIGAAQRFTWPQVAAAAQAQQFAGYQDWRAPTVDELSGLVYCSAGQGPLQMPEGRFQRATTGQCLGDAYQQPTIALHIFPATAADWYWTGSAYAPHARDAWGVSFAKGNVSWGVKGNESYLRLVRTIPVTP